MLNNEVVSFRSAFKNIYRYINKLRQFKYLTLIIIVGLYLCFSQKYSLRHHKIRSPPGSFHSVDMTRLDQTLDPHARPDVPTHTSWSAPIVWEGTFNATLYDKTHRKAASSVAVTVFAVGKYLEAFLENFLVSAERFFMPGLPVTYFVFTDRPEAVPWVKLGHLRELRVMKVEKHHRWQDISMMRMRTLSDLIQDEIHLMFSHLFCFDVDLVFVGRWGSEALGESVAQIHAGYYKNELSPYDKNNRSKAYLPKGDFYYHASIFGGSPLKVKELVDFCFIGIMQDKANEVEALWHDESHLNKYFYLHKPSRILSPEYCWSPKWGNAPEDVRVHRIQWVSKDYDKVRENNQGL